MSPAVRTVVACLFTPYAALGGLAARYDMSAFNSYITATGVRLMGDISGNSGVNALALNGVSGNYASTPDKAFPTSAIEVVCHLNSPNYTPAALNFLFTKDNNSTQRSFYFGFTAASKLTMGVSANGTALTSIDSSAVIPFPNLTPCWLKGTWRASDGRVQYFTAPDQASEPSAWSQLGTDLLISQASIFDSTTAIEVGSRLAGTGNLTVGIIYSLSIRGSIGGADAFAFNPSFASKLATSLVATTGETWTINTTGDFGARICGARDLANLTGANQPSLSGGGALFNGTSQCLKAPAFALVQPETVYFVGQHVTWNTGTYVYDGGLAINTMLLEQLGTTPQLNVGAGTLVVTPTLATNCVITAIYNAAASLARINRAAPVFATGTIGANNGNGLMLGAREDAAHFGNCLAKEIPIFSTAHDASTQNRVGRFLIRKWGIAA